MQWIVQAGWHDPASHQKGMGFAKLLRQTLGKHTNEMESYVNMLDCVKGGVGALGCAALPSAWQCLYVAWGDWQAGEVAGSAGPGVGEEGRMGCGAGVTQ